MNITATPNEENRNLTAEEKKLVDSLSSLAALLGNALFYYGRSVLHLTFEQYEEIEAAAKQDDLFTLAKDPEKEELEAAAAREKGTQFKEPESPGTQVLQALTLMHPSVRQMLGESALYQIFSDALKHYDRTGESLEEQIHGMNLVPLAGLWIITKRVFAFSHQQDCFRIFDALMKGITEKKLPDLPDLEQITDSDRSNMDTFYAAYFAGSPEPVGKEDQPEQKPEEKKMLTYKNLTLDLTSGTAAVCGNTLTLTGKEFAILELMLNHPAKLWSKANLFESVWGEDFITDDNTVKVHMSNIRSKLKKLDPDNEYIETVWGMGYRLVT
jgi:DNA-binding winged helix-turn-helix (wHTH) protein